MPAKKKATIADKIEKGVYDLTGGKLGKMPEKEPTPAKIAETNRKNGLEIIAILKSIHVSHGAYKGDREGDLSPAALQAKIKDAVACIEEANTIQDDVSGIDNVLKYAALALESGVRDGKPEKVKWAKNAICAGAIYWRFDVPEDHAADREENLQARTKYMGYYKSVIENAEIVDDKTNSVKGLTQDLDNAVETFRNLQKEIIDMGSTADGQKLLGEIESNIATPNKLSREAREYQVKLKKAAIEAHAMKTLQGEIIKVNAELNAAQQRMADYRTRLKDKPTAYNPTIMADYAELLDDMVNDIARKLAEAAETERLARDFEAKLDNVLNGQDAQLLAKTLKDTQNLIFSANQAEEKAYGDAGARIIEKYRNQQRELAIAKEKQEERLRQMEEEAAAEAEAAAAAEAARAREAQASENFDEVMNENPNMNFVG